MKEFIFALCFSQSLIAAEITPTQKLSGTITFTDDLDLTSLEKAIDRQLEYYRHPRALTGKIRFGEDTYDKTVLRESLEELRATLKIFHACQGSSQENCSEEFNRELNSRFTIYVPSGKKTRFTAYYSPDLEAERSPSEAFPRPIFSLPPPEIARAFNRVEIDHDEKLSGKNLELLWVSNSFFDIYLLHVQGGGRVTIKNPDGSSDTRYLSMTGHNGKKCEFIGHHMARLGWLPKPDALSVFNQREFLEANPERTREAFRHCQNYIYFRESTEEPVGRNNIPLTEGRSVAIDHTLYPTTGLITFVKVNTEEKNISRFFLAQDTGSKIRGAARSDLYMGYGPEAERTAYSLHADGEQYFLVKKNPLRRSN